MGSTANYSPINNKIAGVFSICSAVLFLAGVALQTQSRWFPEEALQASQMSEWLEMLTNHWVTALVGVGLSCLAIILWTFIVPNIRALTFEEQPLFSWLGSSAMSAGVGLALVAFVMAFGATWGLMSHPDEADATVWMRSFLVMDDVATFMIGGLGAGLFSVAGWRSGNIPKGACIVGFMAAILVTLVLLRYCLPIFAFGAIGYPLIMVWFILIGMVLLRK